MSNEPTIATTPASERVTRVSDRATGHHYTIAASAYDPSRHRPLKSPALDSYGHPAPPKFKASHAAPVEQDKPQDGAEQLDVGAGQPDSGPADVGEGEPPSEPQDGVQGQPDPGVYDDTDDNTEQEDQ